MSIPISGKSLVELVEQLRAVEKERDEAQAKVAEMRAVLRWQCDCHAINDHNADCSFKRQEAINRALSTDCGKDHFHVRELDDVIKLLRDTPGCGTAGGWNTWLTQRDAILAHLEALKPPLPTGGFGLISVRELEPISKLAWDLHAIIGNQSTLGEIISRLEALKGEK